MNVEKAEKIRLKLKDSSVGIAGAGGLGSNAAVALARSGVGRLVIVDFDVVEERNLNRQYYFLQQVGESKVDALQENIRLINPVVKVEIHNVRLEQGSMDVFFHDVDVIIEALDDAETKAQFVEEILLKLPDVPLVAASGVAGYGHCDRVELHRIGKLAMLYDGQAKSSDEDVLLAPRVGVLANWEADLVLELLLGEHDDH